MLTQIRNLILLLCALAVGFQSVFSKPFAAPIFQNSLLAGWVENNDGKLRLILTNNSPQQFRGTCRISLGSDNDQKEIGQVILTIPPQETILLQLNNVVPAGQQYTLAIYDQKGARRFFKIAPLRQISDPTPAQSIAVAPIPQSKPAQTKPVILLQPAGNSSSNAASETDEIIRLTSQVQVQARLLASEDSSAFFILSLDLRTQRPIKDAKIAIVAGKIKTNKLISVYSQAQVEFKLPEQLEAEQISYTMTAKDGRVLAKGELDLQQLMTDGVVIAKDIRTDRSSYTPGDNARLTLLLEGKSLNGYRLEVSAKDSQGQTIFHDQKAIAADDKADSQEFTILIPTNASAPISFEFKIFDSESGLLFDSGEREIPMNTKSSRHL